MMTRHAKTNRTSKPLNITKVFSEFLSSNLIPKLVSQLISDDQSQQLDAIQKFRTLLSQGMVHFRRYL